jgi:hypothetical protein
MNRHSALKNTRLITDEKRSAKLLVEKMGMPKKELEQISETYGVSAFQLLELMQYSKYQFVYEETDRSNVRLARRNPAA